MNHYAYSDYKTTSDHFMNYSEKPQHQQRNNYDSGFHSLGSSTNTSPYYTTPVATDGSFECDGLSTKFDSGRGPPASSNIIHHATRGKDTSHKSSEIVVGGTSAFVSGRSSHYNGGGPQHKALHRSTSAFVPTSSYHTHPPDNRHPKQELIAGGSKLKQLGGATPQQHFNPSVATPGILKNLPTRHSSADNVFQWLENSQSTICEQQDETHFRQRSVSPQFERRVTSTSTKKPSKGANNYSGAGFKTTETASVRAKKMRFTRKEINMAEQVNREISFNQHPLWTGLILPMLLALNGFFFTGQEDLVKCFECLVVLDDWKKDDDVLLRHFNESPNCSFLRKHFLTEIIAGICPKLFSKYSNFAARYTSFKYWPIRCIITEGQMAEAGFFYENIGINAQCYACGIAKDNWKEGDNPIEVHLSLSPDCPHIMEMRTSTVHFQPLQNSHYQVQYKTFEDRLKSFKHMPSSIVVDKFELAQAGFVLIRPPYTVKCLDCNLIIEDWARGEDPLIKHSKYSPDCRFIKSGAGIGLQSVAAPKTKKAVSIAESEIIDEDSLPYGSLVQFPPSYKFQSSTSSSGSGGSRSLPSRQVSNESIINPTSSVGSATSVSLMRSKSTPTSKKDVEDEFDADSSKFCVVCYENLKDCAMVPCGHFCVCMSCAEKLSECPMCRQSKQGVLKIYNS